MDYSGYRGKRLLVQLPDTTIDGTLERASKRAIRLTDARIVNPDTSPIPLDGAVVIERAYVVWVQVL